MGKLMWYTPNMTSDNAPIPYVASASSYSGESNAFRMFAQFDIVGQWLTRGSEQNNSWARIDFGAPITVTKFRMKGSFNAPYESPREFRIEYLNSSSQWISIYSGTVPTWTINEVREFDVPETTARHFRLFVVSVHGGNYCAVSKLQFGREVPTDGVLFTKDSKYYSFNVGKQALVELPNSVQVTKDNYAITKGASIDFTKSYSKKIKVTYDSMNDSFTEEESDVSPYLLSDILGNNPELISFSESNKDVEIATTVSNFDVYESFNTNSEIIYYTDDTSLNNPPINITTNYSPLDELNGDLEVVTWISELNEYSHTLMVEGILSPKLIYSNVINNISKLSKLMAEDLSTFNTKSNLKLLLTNNNTNWFTWSNNSFKEIQPTNENIMLEGMTSVVLNGLTSEDLEKWEFNTLNVGVFLIDDIRNNYNSKIGSLEYNDSKLSNTNKIENVDFYILNTTATIDVDFAGLSLTGQLNDDDMTRVQYRVLLNGSPYYPHDGSFTELSTPPLNINLTLRSEDVNIGVWNDLDVEFKDSFGTVDTWSVRFEGKYAGLIFRDTEGNAYSTDVGAVLQYLDFGTILTGQITPSYEIVMKNEYGYDVKNVTITAKTNEFAEGLQVQFSTDNINFSEEKVISLGDILNDAEVKFYVRMSSTHSTVPNDNTLFDIIVMAEREI